MKGECYFSRREAIKEKTKSGDVTYQTEQMTSRNVKTTATHRKLETTKRKADYLDYSKRANSAQEKKLQAHDASVGFAGSKGDAKMKQSIDNIGQASVAGVWSYQGSRPFSSGGMLFSSMGDTLSCVNPESGATIWKKHLGDTTDSLVLDAALTPPAIVNDKVFVGSASGAVWCLSTKSGQVLWTVTTGDRITFQPAVAQGRVYVSTESGSLYCIETGDTSDTGWSMWGATSAHNGLESKDRIGRASSRILPVFALMVILFGLSIVLFTRKLIGNSIFG